MTEEEERAESGGSGEKKKNDLVLRHVWTFWMDSTDKAEKNKKDKIFSVTTAREFWTVYKPLEMFLEPIGTERETELLKVKAPMKCNLILTRDDTPPEWQNSFYSFRVARGEKENSRNANHVENAKRTENAKSAVTNTLLNVISGNPAFEIVRGVNIRVRPSVIGIDIWFISSTTKALRTRLTAILTDNNIVLDKALARYSQPITDSQKKEAKAAAKSAAAAAAAAATDPSVPAESSSSAASPAAPGTAAKKKATKTTSS